MKMNDSLLRCVGISLALFAGTAVAALPEPVLSGPSLAQIDKAAAEAALAGKSPDELSAAFWVKFDKLPSSGSPTGLFECSADEKGFVTIRLTALPTQFQGDFEMKSTEPVKRGEWRHIEFSYSRIHWRAAFYIDGKFQWENDNLNLPATKFGPAVAESFSGEVRDFRLYDFALANEYLALADKVAESCAEIRKTAQAAAASAKSPALKEWAEGLVKTADGYVADSASVTVAAIADLKRDAENARAIAEASAAQNLTAAAGRLCALYTVKPLTQEIFLPYALPKCGEIVPEMRIVASPGEYENGSIVAVAYKPLKVTRVTVSDLRGPDGKVIPAAETDIKLVKRWIRCGGAWLTYHADRRQRNLTPDLLINDDALIKVDEFRTRNFIRLDYPEGKVYADVSDPYKGHTSWNNGVPFQDAKTIQPHEISEAGRNQQYMFTFHVPAGTPPGVYRGSIGFSIPGGDASVAVALRVLPIALPDEPSSYADLDNVYITHMNSFPAIYGATLKQREENTRAELANIHAHNMNHTTGIWNSPELAKMSLDVGFVPDKLFCDNHAKSWRAFFPAVPAGQLTAADKEAGTRAAIREVAEWSAFLAGTFPKTAEQYVIFHSEDGSYGGLVNTQAEEAYVAHRLGQRVFAHTMTDKAVAYSGDIQDMTSSTAISAEEARKWHVAGGELINYADPFPGSENPEWFRRKMGFLMYKTGLDGQMMHGFRQGRTPWNEFTEDLGGDGNYRNFCLCYPMRNGSIYTVAWEGVREAYDDLRYATRLRQLAQANLEAESDALRREAKRAQIWLELQDGKSTDLDAIRMGLIERILILQDTIARHNGVLPDANKAVKR